MVRIPSFARRSNGTATRDENNDGRIDARDDKIAKQHAKGRAEVATAARPATDEEAVAAEGRRDQVDDRSTYRSRAATAADATAAERAADRAERAADRDAPTPVQEPVVHRRPRASLLATLGLVFGAVAALGVLSGVLAAYGVALGAVGLLLSGAGMAATGRRHVAGKADAMFGLALSAGALVLGVLALSDALPWLTTDTDNATRLRDWLDTQWTSRF